MLFCGWYYDCASCINGKSRAELPLPYEAICLPLNPMECGNVHGGTPPLGLCGMTVRAEDALASEVCPAMKTVSGHRGSKGANLAKMGSTADHFTVAVRASVLLAHQLIESPHPLGRGALGESSGQAPSQS